ncbi:hypothetical protein POM88_027114 [Heracleum sosnowskyi]|uniref:Uncharacterized protein n=1 Tax=Heracleum sosnowskyi TaxID=360622 RepID=A0AAD8ML71_9APIA|nr:hypothetical protein POM88_027114 [Heracleum sosnowskyi]
MKFYGVRIFGIIQFDYYDNGLFNVNIFKKTAIECYYPLSDPRAYKKSEAAKEYNIDEFLINFDSLEYFKRIEQLSFNGFFLEPHYAEIEIMTKDIDPISPVLIVPKLVRDNYSEKLKQIKILEVYGVESPIFYDPSSGCLKGLKKMTDFYYLRQKETVFFIMEQDTNILTTRVYAEDGIEIDYLTRPLGLTSKSEYVWIWHIDSPFYDGTIN